MRRLGNFHLLFAVQISNASLPHVVVVVNSYLCFYLLLAFIMRLRLNTYRWKCPEYDIPGDSGSANREPVANIAEANAGHRYCDIVDHGPQKRLNYNDKGLKLRDARLTSLVEGTQRAFCWVINSAKHSLWDNIVAALPLQARPNSIMIDLAFRLRIRSWSIWHLDT
jgi:hypothetical protein